MNQPRKSTPRQVEASRANGRLSNGPKTDAGKASSSKNAVKNGFFAAQPLIPGESEEAFADFRRGLVKGFRPDNPAEEMLVDHIADCAWRMRRIPSVEAALFTSELLEEQASLLKRKIRGAVSNVLVQQLVAHAQQANGPQAKDSKECREWMRQEAAIREQMNSPQYALGRAFRRDASAAAGFTSLTRAEMMVGRGFHRSLRELQNLQAARKAEGNGFSGDKTNPANSQPAAGQ